VRALFLAKHRYDFTDCFHTPLIADASRNPWSCSLSPRGHRNLYQPMVSFRRHNDGRWIGAEIHFSDAQ
jgi:hypothetical protein